MTDDELKQLVAANATSIAQMSQEISDLKTSTGNLRVSIESLRDIIVDHQRRVMRLEGREIDLWGDHLSLEERVRALESWKANMENK